MIHIHVPYRHTVQGEEEIQATFNEFITDYL